MSDNKNPKVLTLDNIDILKTYIDRNIKSVNEQISDTDKKWEDKYNVISKEQQEKLNEKIEEAKNNLTERYEEKLANFESKINNATKEELSILINKIEILKSDFEQCNTALDKIKEDISDSSSIFNAAELDELINCANIEETYVDEDGNLNSEKILAKNITALIARFGTVKAANIQGDTISGKTIQSTTIRNNTDSNSGQPAWKINNNGQITIIDTNGYKSEIGGDDIIKIFDDDKVNLTLNKLGLKFGTQTLYSGDRIYMTDGLEDENTVLISAHHNDALIRLRDCSVSVSGISNRINLTVGDYSIALSNTGIEFYGLEPGYLYVNSDGILTTKQVLV